MRILCPTINQTKGGVSLLPIPVEQLKAHSYKDYAIAMLEVAAKQISCRETARQFRQPSSATHGSGFTQLLVQIDDLAYKGYGLDSRRKFIAEFLETFVPDADDSEDAQEETQNEGAEDSVVGNESEASASHARMWISYAVGIVLGRFQVGVSGGMGCGDFPAKVVAEISKLVDSDGLMASDENHPQDIVKRTLDCLVVMLGRDAAQAAIRTAAENDGDPEELLRNWIDRQFWKYHYQLYRKRPAYWPLQSPNKKFTVWVFHEQFSKDTLFRVKDQFVQVKINWLNGRIRDLKPKTLSSDTRERRAAEKEISKLSDTLDDVQEFAECLKRITERGYTPHIDDGVLLNAAPLWELLPAWKDAEKAWQELENEEYEWAQQAMEYWPDRVKKACQTNKSFAIAHGRA